MNTNYLMKKENFHYFIECSGLISLNHVVFSFKIYFSFSFCSDFNLEATVGKTDEIRDLKQLPPVSLNCKKHFFQNN